MGRPHEPVPRPALSPRLPKTVADSGTRKQPYLKSQKSLVGLPLNHEPPDTHRSHCPRFCDNRRLCIASSIPVSYVDVGIPFTGIYETTRNITYGFVLPPLTSLNAIEFIGEIIAPIANKWVGVALGGPDSLMVVGWPNETEIFGSPRYVGASLDAQMDASVNVTTIGSSVNATHWTWIYRCENCTEWAGGSLALDGTQTMEWLVGLEPVLTPDADNSTLSAHNATGSWEQNLAAAHNANYSSFAVSSSSSWSRKSSNFGQSQCGPAITTHAGDLWISGVMNNHTLWYASANNTDYLQPTTSVNTETAAEGPALADFADVLHLVFPDSVSGKLVHLQYNDTTGAWGQRLVLNVTSSGPPALTVFNGALVLAYMDPSDSNRLYVAEWDPVVGWGPSYNLGGQSWGTPALYTLGSQIYILFPANNSGRKVLAMSATAVNDTWTTATAPNESTAYGTSAATYETNAVMAFQSNNGKGQLFASFYNGAAWLGHEDTGQTTSHTPAIVVLDGIANCVFSSHDASSSVLWIQRPVSLYPLNSWMAHLSGSLLLSQLSIPGTHDSASVTFVPFTATQELSIPAQLDLGIRFLDLRCKLVFNSLLMFHGDVPLGPTLQQILLQIYSWLGHSSSETVIVSLKQEGSALNSTITFDTAVLQLIQPQSQFWNTSGTIPQLQDIRGKIQLISRYGGASIGINATNWPDNVPGFTTPLPNGALAIEDYYDYDGVIGLDVVVTNKTGYVLNALAAAQADTSISNWYISFSTASNTPFNFPETLAVGGTAYTILGFPFVTGINRRILTYLNSLLISPAPYPKVGTVLMDFPDTPDGGGLIEAIVSLNG